MPEKSQLNGVIRRNVFASFAIKGVALVVAFLSTPAYIRYFDNDSVLGFWFTVVAVLNWLLFFDFGIGNGLRNHLGRAIVNKNAITAKRLVSSAYFVMGLIALGTFVVGVLVFSIIDVVEMMSVDTSIVSRDVWFQVVLIVFGGVILHLWLKLISSVLNALQKTALPSLVTLISNLLILIVLVWKPEISIAEKLVLLAATQVASINVPLVVISLIVFKRYLPNATPSIKYVGKNESKVVIYLGGAFFFIQLMLLFISSTNELLITAFCNTADVVYYSVYYRLFYLIVTMFGLFVQPLWSALNYQYHSGNYDWMKKVHNRFVMAASVASILSFLLVIPLQTIIDIWLGSSSFGVEACAALAFASLASTMLFVNSSTCIANATSKLKPQIVTLAIGVLLRIPLCMLMLSLLGGHWASIVWSNVLCLLPCAIIQLVATKKEFKTGILKPTNREDGFRLEENKTSNQEIGCL